MRKTIVLIFAIFASSFLQAQDAKKLLQEVSAKVKSYDNIFIDFKYNLSHATNGKNQETRGDVTLEGDKYLLNMLGTTRIFDGKEIFSIVPEDEEVTVSRYSAKDDTTITPSKMLTFYEKGYTYKMDIVQDVKGRKIQFIKLTPTDSKAEMKSVLLGVDPQTKHIYKLIQTDGNGNTYTLTVNSFKTNQPVSKTLFTFDEAKYKKDGYYINRL